MSGDFEPNKVTTSPDDVDYDFAQSVHEDVARAVINGTINHLLVHMTPEEKVRALGFIGIDLIKYVENVFDQETDMRVDVFGKDNLQNTDSYREFQALCSQSTQENKDQQSLGSEKLSKNGDSAPPVEIPGLYEGLGGHDKSKSESQSRLIGGMPDRRGSH